MQNVLFLNKDIFMKQLNELKNEVNLDYRALIEYGIHKSMTINFNILYTVAGYMKSKLLISEDMLIIAFDNIGITKPLLEERIQSLVCNYHEMLNYYRLNIKALKDLTEEELRAIEYTFISLCHIFISVNES